VALVTTSLSLLTSNNPNTRAAVANTGMPELAGLPNTIAGIGLGYLAIKKSAGATNVYVGPNTPYYAAMGDIMNFPPSDTDPLAWHVDYLYSCFGPFGMGSNQTGTMFDFSAGAPRAVHQDGYTVMSSRGYDGRDAWSTSDTASVNSPPEVGPAVGAAPSADRQQPAPGHALQRDRGAIRVQGHPGRVPLPVREPRIDPSAPSTSATSPMPE
jgi:hypothetical protein